MTKSTLVTDDKYYNVWMLPHSFSLSIKLLVILTNSTTHISITQAVYFVITLSSLFYFSLFKINIVSVTFSPVFLSMLNAWGPSNGLNNIITTLVQGWLWHWITLEGWYEKRNQFQQYTTSLQDKISAERQDSPSMCPGYDIK